MFCNNASYHTDRQQNCQNYCSSQQQKKPVISYNYLPTQQSQRNPSNFYKNVISGRSYQQNIQSNNQQNINQMNTLELMNENSKKQCKKLQAIQRNKNMSAILSIILAFSQRIQALKQKLCGYPAQNFSPVQFFNVLDITQKGYVDLYDIKRFVNNQKIREKDIISLFKRVNGDHAKDNAKLTYFGYLNLIKPYFNQQLARDLLLRDAISKKQANKNKSQNASISKVDNQMIEPTQQSVLLLFQELILLHCICSSQHEQAKQLLMNQYMLNTLQVKQIIGLDNLDAQKQNIKNLSLSKEKTSRIKYKSPLSVLYQFIQNNSQFQIQFEEMKFLLSFLNCHQFSLINDKYISILFLPTNCKKQILTELQKKKTQIQDFQGTQNYMNTYLTKQNLINRGNMQMIKDYLDEKAVYNTSGHQTKVMGRTLGGPSKANFLQFVHPRSLQRVNPHYQDLNNIKDPQFLMHPVKQHQLAQYQANQYPQFQINASNKIISQNQSSGYNQARIPVSQRQYSNNSSIPQQNIRVVLPRQTLPRQDYESLQRQKHDNILRQSNGNKNQILKNEFYGQNNRYNQQEDINISKISNTPFLQQFMKKSNILRSNKKQYRNDGQFRKVVINEQNSVVNSSDYSNSAFEVIDYGYQSSKINHYDNKNNKNTQIDKYVNENQRIKKYADQSQRIKKQTLDSRYNMVVSQYKNKNNNEKYQSSGPKFQKSFKKPQSQVRNQQLNYSKGNYIQNVGLSQSNMVNQSSLLNKFSSGGNILNQFLKK